MLIRREIFYIEEDDENVTEHVLNLAKKRGNELGIKDFIVASTTGQTALKAARVIDPSEYNLIIVTHATGFKSPGEQEFDEKIRLEIEKKGVKVLTCIHGLSGVERSLRKQLGIWGPVELMANALRLFGEGAKVAIEITIMAADAGLIPMDKDVIAIAGTGRGADSAYVIKPAHSSNFFDLFVKEIICKPLYH